MDKKHTKVVIVINWLHDIPNFHLNIDHQQKHNLISITKPKNKIKKIKKREKS